MNCFTGQFYRYCTSSVLKMESTDCTHRVISDHSTSSLPTGLNDDNDSGNSCCKFQLLAWTTVTVVNEHTYLLTRMFLVCCCAAVLEIYKVVSQKQTCDSPDDDDLSPTSPGPRGIGVSSAAGPSADQPKKSCCSSS